MNDAIDGLDSPELIRDIVEELVREFPTLEVEALTTVVEECRQRIARPATGGALFLEARKLSQLMADHLEYPVYAGSSGGMARQGTQLQALQTGLAMMH